MNAEERTVWLEARRHHIGASEVAAVLGVDPWRGPLAVYEAKINGSSQSDADYLAFGRDVEGAIANLYAHRTGRPVRDLGASEIQYHPEYPWIGATLDRVTEGTPSEPAPGDGPGPLELKHVSKFQSPEDWKADPPLNYQIQLQIQMSCTGAQWGCLAGMFPGYQLAWVDVKRNDSFLAAAYPILAEFWERVQRKDPPPPDGTTGTGDAIKRLWPRESPEKTITIEDDRILSLVTEWDGLKGAEREAQKRIKELDAIIRATMQDAEIANCGAFKLSLKTVKKKAFSVEASEYRQLRKVKK